MGSCLDKLNNHTALIKRAAESERLVKSLKSSIIADSYLSRNDKLCIYAAGSLGRYEFGSKSDLDVFAISSCSISRLDKIRFYASIISINNNLGLPEFSNDGEFLKVFHYNEHEKAIGSPKDDHDNWFTARMLLLLESKPIYNEALYSSIAQKIIELYFRDKEKNSTNFKPIFFLNDLLRFWRTLCLNYERIRSDTGRPYRKKNINLKYSRRLSVFATVLYLVANPKIDENGLLKLIELHPLKRLALALDSIGDQELIPVYNDILEYYEKFLALKEIDDIDTQLKHNNELARDIEENSIRFRGFIFKLLNHKSIDPSLREYLVV